MSKSKLTSLLKFSLKPLFLTLLHYICYDKSAHYELTINTGDSDLTVSIALIFREECETKESGVQIRYRCV